MHETKLLALIHDVKNLLKVFANKDVGYLRKFDLIFLNIPNSTMFTI